MGDSAPVAQTPVGPGDRLSEIGGASSVGSAGDDVARPRRRLSLAATAPRRILSSPDGPHPHVSRRLPTLFRDSPRLSEARPTTCAGQTPGDTRPATDVRDPGASGAVEHGLRHPLISRAVLRATGQPQQMTARLLRAPCADGSGPTHRESAGSSAG